MITRSEVVKLLMEEIDRCRRAPDLNGCEMQEEWQRTIDVCSIAVNAILEQEERRWIPVTERLPDCEYGSESKPLFFVTRFGDIEAGYFGMGGIYRDKYFRIYRDRYEGYDADDIVCWMWQSALSEPPKEDAT